MDQYSSNPGEFQKFAPPTAPPNHGYAPATGIPVTAPNYVYTDYNAPVPPRGPPQFHSSTPGSWSTGLCDCFSDVPNCCITCWCPCITFGQIAEIVDKGSTSCGASGALYGLIAYFTGCACIYSCFYRSRMRQQYLLPENPCADCLVHFCCESCALCQEHRELKNRGFDMSIGWHGNMEKQNRELTMAPIGQQGMDRGRG